MNETTIYQVVQESVRRFGDRRALGFRQGDGHAYFTYSELWDRVHAFRRGLAALGLQKGDRIAILSENRPEWAIADLAAQCMGVVDVPIYPSLPANQAQFMASDSAARVLIVSDKKQLAKALEIKSNLRTLEHIVTMDSLESEDAISFEQVIERGQSMDDAALDAVAESLKPEDVATFIYTSGTTGDPKGAMLSHWNLLYTGFAARQVVRIDENDVFLSFAPLSHIVERTGGHYLPLMSGSLIVYSQGLFTIASEFAQVKPTIFLCVPRLYESMEEKIREGAAKQPEKKRKAFEWALATGKVAAEAKQKGKSAGPINALKMLVADKLVLRKIREKVTGGRIRFLVAGGAPLNPQTACFFESLGLNMLQGYGLTEHPVISLNHPEKNQWGTVGPILPGIEVKFAGDGELLSRGPSLMKGYFGKADATAEAIDADGWFHTGDIGELTADGFLKITDRKKDIIVLANGKNVAPQPIEARLKESEYISEVVMLGDSAQGVIAIVVPNFERLRTWAKAQEIDSSDIAALTARSEVRSLFKKEIDRLSAQLADFERIKRFALVGHAFSIEGGELTPTLKVKRKAVAQKYADLLGQLAR